MSDFQVAIDPLALILSGRIYALIHLPDPPPNMRKVIAEMVKGMSAAEKEAVLNRAKALGAYASAIQNALR
jgi:hypothetical protein